MGRRIDRRLRPSLEAIEHRALLSAITDLLSLHSRAASLNGNYGSTIMLGNNTLNQGPLLNADGSVNNMALAPSGAPKPGALKRQQFTARFVGPYSVIPGRTTAEAAQTLIQGAGTANTMLHSDIQIRLVTPKDPGLPIGGVLSIFDRNLNSNTVLGLDLSAPQSNVDRAGRPNLFTSVSLDANESAGVYDEAYAQGVLKIRYIPGGHRSNPQAVNSGTAIVTIHAQIYAPNTSFILRNSSINP